MLAAGRSTWPSPDVLPWGAWLERELDRARIRGEPVPRRLSGLSAWLLWREAVLHAAEPRQVLAPLRLIDPVRASVALLEDYAVEPRADDSAEAALLLAARAHFRRSCQALGALDSSSWVACAPFARPSARVLLAGFSALGPALRGWLERHGAHVLEHPLSSSQEAHPVHSAAFPAAPPARPGVARRDDQPPRVVGASIPSAEAEAAADWCARRLAADPRARLLVMVSGLAEQRHLWQRALAQRLDYESILQGTAGAARSSAYAIEGGQPLDSFPLTRAALAVIRLGADHIDFDSLSALLRSPYLPAWDLALRCRLDVWLRQQNVDIAGRANLEALRGLIARELGPGVAGIVRSLLERAEPAGGGCAPRFAAWLAGAGWPGSGLSGEELQVRMRFDELLGELAAAEALRAPLTPGEAANLLCELAARTGFEAASDDVAVTVTSILSDPIVRYDGIWVAGLTADAWPAPVQPDPLLPLTLQYRAGLPQASAQAQLQQAQQLLRIWAAGTIDCVLSWAASEEERPCDPSPLLQVAPSPPPVVQQGFCLERWLTGLAAPLTPWRDIGGPRWPAQPALPRGTKLLELQALCPFRGFAQLRLGALELPRPGPGIDDRWRGQILHRALELLWGELRDQDSLRSRDAQSCHDLVRRAATQATREVLQERSAGMYGELLPREQARTEALLLKALEWERARAPFSVQALEAKRPLTLGEATLRLRLDRVDRLEDGRLAIIDYKSGREKTFDALAGRLTQPQLPAYAVATGEAVAAVLALHVRPGSLAVRGIADRPNRITRLPGPPPQTPWPELLTRWEVQLQALVREFLDGHAAVDPQPKACERCHLHTLCRIDASAWAGDDEPEDGTADENGAAGDADAMNGDGAP